MKIVIFLNGDRGLAVLNSLLKEPEYKISAIVTPLEFNAEKLPINTNSLHLKFQNVNQDDALKAFKNLKPDLFLIAGYSDIFKSNLIEIPKEGVLNLHAGKLPEYRGGSPLNWQIINGEKEAGLSVIKIDCGIDTGPVIAECKIPITDETTINELHKIANEKFPKLVFEALSKITSGIDVARVQQNDKARYWHQRNDNDGRLDFCNSTAIEIQRVIRAITLPYPGAWAYSVDDKVRIYAARLADIELCGSPGRICYIQGKDPYVICRSGALLLTNYKFELNPSQKLKNGEYLN